MAEQDNNTSKSDKPKGALGDLVTAESMIQLALALPVGCGLGWAIGAALDKHFHTEWMAIVGVLLGAAGGFIQIIRAAMKTLNRGGK